VFRQIITVAVAAGFLASATTAASSRVRHHAGHQYAPSYGSSAGERTDPTNTNGF
jgi:hypothetical protein